MLVSHIRGGAAEKRPERARKVPPKAEDGKSKAAALFLWSKWR